MGVTSFAFTEHVSPELPGPQRWSSWHVAQEAHPEPLRSDGHIVHKRIQHADRYYLVGIGSCGAELCPSLGELAAFLAQVAAPISGFHLVRYGMRQRHFGDLGRKAGALGGPIAKTGSETV